MRVKTTMRAQSVSFKGDPFRKLFGSLRSRVRRRLLALGALAALGALSGMTMRSQAQRDPGLKVLQVIYQGDHEVGRVYRDGPGPKYTEHWVLFPNYTYDQDAQHGDSIHIVAYPGRGYTSLHDFLTHVPFPEGSRYVVVECHESNELPVGR
jgi:hypothetical protein